MASARSDHTSVGIRYRRMMIRTQIRLTEHQAATLKRVAREHGVSMASVIRDAVDSIIDEADRQAKVERAIGAIGGFTAGGRDVAREHDRCLEDAWEA